MPEGGCASDPGRRDILYSPFVFINILALFRLFLALQYLTLSY